jgi:UDPglucose 6-dehydrogenase
MNDKCVIGYGYVGKSTALAFNIEKYYTRHDGNITFDEISKCRYIFICLPTPTIDGKCFTDDIKSFIEMISKYPNPNDRTIIIRSTVPPGFAKSFNQGNIVSNPEFLSESTWEKDATNPWLVVVGGEPQHRERIVGLYRGRFKYSKPFETDNTTAELIKYSLNTFFATKVVFANEIFNIAQAVGANYEAIKTVLEGVPWGSKNHFQIYYKEKRGVHGSCLPKDTEALANFSQSPFFKMISERKYD